MLFFRHAEKTAGGAVQKLREMETYKKQTNLHQYFCFCSVTILTSKIITEIIENHSEFFCWVNSCNKFVSIRSCQNMKLSIIL